jgi:hypothetical protein
MQEIEKITMAEAFSKSNRELYNVNPQFFTIGIWQRFARLEFDGTYNNYIDINTDMKVNTHHHKI